MAISLEFANKLSEGVGGSYFSLKNDKEFALVRFAYGSLDDVYEDIYAVHKEDRTTYECARKTATDSIEVCPLCAKGDKTKAVVYLSLFNVETGEIQIWEKTYSWFKSTLIPFFTDVMSANPGIQLCQMQVKITRCGAKGDMKTTYSLFPVNTDNVTVDSLPSRGNLPIKQISEMTEKVSNEPIPANTPVNHDSFFRGM